MLDKYGETLSAKVQEKINFFPYSSNETLKAVLEGKDSDNHKIILVTAPLNEIVHKLKTGKKKGRDETIKTVIEEQNKLVNASAVKEGRLGVLHLVTPPLLRLEPAWMDERIRLVTLYMRDYIAERSPWNVGIGNPIDVTSVNLNNDKVHLNDMGLEKLYKGLEKDLLKCKENLGEGPEFQLSQDWASQVMDESIRDPPTPGTMRKRGRTQDPDTSDEEDDDEESVNKKTKKDTAEDKMDKIYALMKEMKKDNKLARTDVVALRDKVDSTDKKVDNLMVEFNGLKGECVRDTELTAEMREDEEGAEGQEGAPNICSGSSKGASQQSTG